MTVVLMLLALALVVGGVALIYVPAAMIVAGMLTALGVVGFERGTES